MEKRGRVVRRAGATEDGPCGTGANPPRSMRRFYRVSETRIKPGRPAAKSLTDERRCSPDSVETLGVSKNFNPTPSGRGRDAVRYPASRCPAMVGDSIDGRLPECSLTARR
jgi:hypothetical protein